MLFLVANMLPFAIPLDGLRVLLAIPPPVIGIPGAPFLSAIQTSLAVFRVRGDFLAVVIGAAPPLADRIAAYRLPRLKLGWLETALAIPTLAYAHIGGCRTGEARFSEGRFRSWYRVLYRVPAEGWSRSLFGLTYFPKEIGASAPRGTFIDYKPGANAALLNRH